MVSSLLLSGILVPDRYAIGRRKKETTMKRNTIGLDLAKNIFHVVVLDHNGKQIMRKQLRRNQVASWFVRQPPSLVGIEACGSSHYWARKLIAQGHKVKLIAAQHVKAFLRGQKNDYNDAAAIAEAVSQPQMRFVAIKSAAQLDLQAMQRIRTMVISNRTGLSNQLRGLLAEHGIVMPKSLKVLRQRIPELLEDADNGLSTLFRYLLHLGWQRLSRMDEEIKGLDRELSHAVKQDTDCQLLMSIPGYGPVVSSSFSVVVGDGSCFKRGRDVAASLGLVPRQHSTGGKPKLLDISKRGNKELRTLLVQGAKAVLRHANGKQDPLCQWALKISARHGPNKAAVALANKLARIGWAVLNTQTPYQAGYALKNI
jgi:transposase